MTPELNKQRVIDFFAHLGAPKNVAGAMAMMADDGSWWVNGPIGQLPFFGQHDKTTITALLNSLVPVMTHGLLITPVHLVAEGNHVSMESTSYGELPNGRTYTNRCHFAIELRDGQILHVREYMDTQALLQAVAP